MRYIYTILALLIVSVSCMGQTPWGTPNGTMNGLGGFSVDSAFRPPIVPITKRYTKQIGVNGQIAVNSADTTPFLIRGNVANKIFVSIDTNKAGCPTTPAYVASVVATAGGAFVPLSQKAAALGVATLDGAGLIPITQIPALPINNTFVAANLAAMLALSASVGDVCVRSDSSISFILQVAGATIYTHWIKILAPQPVLSFGPVATPRIGNVIPLLGDYSTDSVAEGANLYFTAARTNTVVATDTGSSGWLANKNDIAKLISAPTQTLLGRYTASTGAIQQVTIGANLTLNATTGVLSSNAGSGTLTGVIGGQGITVTGTAPTPTVSLTPVTVYTITESTQMALNFTTNGPVQYVTLAHANDTITLAGITVVDKKYTLYVQNDGVTNRILRWGTTVKAAYGSQGQPPHSTTAGVIDRYIITIGPGGALYVDYGLNYNGCYWLLLLLLFSIGARKKRNALLVSTILILPAPSNAQTYIHPQAQKFCSLEREVNGYAMRAKDVSLVHGFALRIYGGLIFGTDTFLDLHTKVKFCYPIIGTTNLSQGVDFLRLTALPITSWVSTPAGSPATALDGSFSLASNAGSPPTNKFQYLKTDFTPPPNQSFYHVSYYSTTNSAPRHVVEVGNANGATQLLAMGVYQNLVTTGSGLGNMYGAYPSTPSVTYVFGAISSGFFTLNLNPATPGSLDMSIDGGFAFGTASFATASSSPGQIWLGHDANSVWGYSDRGCEGACGGAGLSEREITSEYKSFLFLHNNK